MADFGAALTGNTKPTPDDAFEEWLTGKPKSKPSPASVTRQPIALIGDIYRRRALGVLQKACDELAATGEGARNHALNREAFNMARFINDGLLTKGEVDDALTAAALAAGLPQSEVDYCLHGPQGLGSDRHQVASAQKRGNAPALPPSTLISIPPAHTLTDENGQPLTEASTAPIDPGDADAAPEYTDFAAVLAGGIPEPPKPAVLRRDDGVGTFYYCKRNELYGDPEDGKTMVLLAAAAQELTSRYGKVLFLDLDNNGAAETAHRLMMLGVDPAVLTDRNRFRHIEPADAQEVLRVVTDCAGWATLVGIDCVGELMPLFRASSDSADDYTRVMQQASAPFERGGAAVILLDHQAKSAESRNYGAGGTMAKRRAVSGVSINLVRKQSFVPGQGGMADLWINKDRPGGLRAHCPKGEGRRQFAGTFVLEAPDTDGVAAWRVTADRTEPSTTVAIDPVVERHYDAVVALTEKGQAATVAAVAAHAHGVPDETAVTQNQKVAARRYLTKLTETGRLTKVLHARPEQWEVAA